MKRVLYFVVILLWLAPGTSICDSIGNSPQHGGILRIIDATGGTVIGYYPEMGPNDGVMAMPGCETMLNLNEQRQFEGQLAESYEIDEKNLTMTFHIRKGVKFHDGSDFNSHVAAWNYNLFMKTGKIQFSDQIEYIEAVDEFTLVLHLKQYNNQMLYAYGWVPIWSQAAYEKHGQEWCRKNLVGTGPFKQKEWKRDSYLKWERFEDYWQKGKPYLDGIEVKYIPDPMTASQLMQAREADLWRTPPVREQATLAHTDLIRKSYWTGQASIIYLNTKNTDSPTYKKKVREAIEYAINKPAITKAVGFGFCDPIYLFHPPGNWAHDPTYSPRLYDPEKARQLLTEAGYPDGLNLKLLAFEGWGGGRDTAEAIKANMDAAGFSVEVDMADQGRYFGSLFGRGWEHMILSINFVSHNSLAAFQAWYGHEPKSNLASFKRPEELIEMSQKSIALGSENDQEHMTRKMARYIADEALMVPINFIPSAYLIQPWVHTNYLECGSLRWRMEDIWMEKQ